MEYDMDIPVFHRHVLAISKSEVGFPRTALFLVGLWHFQGGISKGTKPTLWNPCQLRN